MGAAFALLEGHGAASELVSFAQPITEQEMRKWRPAGPLVAIRHAGVFFVQSCNATVTISHQQRNNGADPGRNDIRLRHVGLQDCALKTCIVAVSKSRRLPPQRFVHRFVSTTGLSRTQGGCERGTKGLAVTVASLSDDGTLILSHPNSVLPQRGKGISKFIIRMQVSSCRALAGAV